jgi:hypothetical protein
VPFKSQAQIAKFKQLLKDGKINQKTFDEWMAATPKEIPERVRQKVKRTKPNPKVDYSQSKFAKPAPKKKKSRGK